MVVQSQIETWRGWATKSSTSYGQFERRDLMRNIEACDKKTHNMKLPYPNMICTNCLDLFSGVEYRGYQTGPAEDAQLTGKSRQDKPICRACGGKHRQD